MSMTANRISMPSLFLKRHYQKDQGARGTALTVETNRTPLVHTA